MERGPAHRPHRRPDFAARRPLSGGVRRAPAPPPGEDVRTPGSPPPAAAGALLAAGEGSGLGMCGAFPPAWASPSPLRFQVGEVEDTCHSGPIPPRRVGEEGNPAFSRPHPERHARHPAWPGNT